MKEKGTKHIIFCDCNISIPVKYELMDACRPERDPVPTCLEIVMEEEPQHLLTSVYEYICIYPHHHILYMYTLAHTYTVNTWAEVTLHTGDRGKS